MGISDIAAEIEQFKLGMIQAHRIYLQIKQSNTCNVCGDPDVKDKDYRYPYGKDKQGCCKICYVRDFIGEPTPVDGLNGYK